MKKGKITFFDVKTKKPFTTDDYIIKERGEGGIDRKRAETTSPSGVKAIHFLKDE